MRGVIAPWSVFSSTAQVFDLARALICGKIRKPRNAETFEAAAKPMQAIRQSEYNTASRLRQLAPAIFVLRKTTMMPIPPNTDEIFAEFAQGMREALKGMDADISNRITEQVVISADEQGNPIYHPYHTITLVSYNLTPPITVEVHISPYGSYVIHLYKDSRYSLPGFVHLDRRTRQPLIDFKAAIASSLEQTKARLTKEGKLDLAPGNGEKKQ